MHRTPSQSRQAPLERHSTPTTTHGTQRDSVPDVWLHRVAGGRKGDTGCHGNRRGIHSVVRTPTRHVPPTSATSVNPAKAARPAAGVIRSWSPVQPALPQQRPPVTSRESVMTTGYVFVCDSATQVACESGQILTAPAMALSKMQRSITAKTKLFLYNQEACLLIGRFVAVGLPTVDILFGATSTKLMAQVEVKPFDLSLHETTSAYVSTDSKLVAGVTSLETNLKRGRVLSKFLQKKWNATKKKWTAHSLRRTRPRRQASCSPATAGRRTNVSENYPSVLRRSSCLR